MSVDPSLLARAHKLDREALEELHNELYPVVFRYLAYRLQDPQLCEDLASEVFLRMIDTFRRGERTILDAKAWMLGTASNLVNDHFRQKYRRKFDGLDNHENLASPHSTEGAAELRLDIQEVKSAIQQLTPDQQDVLALRFSQDRSIEETAHLTGKSISAVKVLQFRALAALRRLLDQRKKI